MLVNKTAQCRAVWAAAQLGLARQRLVQVTSATPDWRAATSSLWKGAVADAPLLVTARLEDAKLS